MLRIQSDGITIRMLSLIQQTKLVKKHAVIAVHIRRARGKFQGLLTTG